MEESLIPTVVPVVRRAVSFIAAAVVAVGGFGYAVHEHHSAQSLSNQNRQMTAQLDATRSQLNVLNAKVNELMTQAASKPSPAVPVAAPAPSHPAVRRRVAHRPNAVDMRFQKMQSQLDAQGKAIDQTRGDLASARTELSGGIAKNHTELVALERKGEHNYFEFDIDKTKVFKREGPLSVKLKKANVKRQYADLLLIVDDRDLSQKHVNLYQPVMFYQPDSVQPVEVVINQISKNHIHGYVSAPKYRQSELAAMSNDDSNPVSGSAPASDQQAQPSPRQRLPLPASTPDQQ
jgi:Spy/CpxP family protein refolding chaperone